MQRLDQFRRSDMNLLFGLAQRIFVSFRLNLNAQRFTSKRNASFNTALNLLKVISCDPNRFRCDSDRRLRFQQLEIRIGGLEQTVLPLTLNCKFGSPGELACGEIFVDRITKINLPTNGWTNRIRFLVCVKNGAADILDKIVMPTITGACRNPRKELPDRSVEVRSRFSQPFARNLNIEIPRAGEPQRGWQVNLLNTIGRCFWLGGDDASNQRSDHAKPNRSHLASEVASG